MFRFCERRNGQAMMRSENEAKDTIRVIICRADEFAKVVEIEDSLEAMQELVGGLIEEYAPWEDAVAVVCHEFQFLSQRANGFLTVAGGIIITFTREILTM